MGQNITNTIIHYPLVCVLRILRLVPWYYSICLVQIQGTDCCSVWRVKRWLPAKKEDTLSRLFYFLWLVSEYRIMQIWESCDICKHFFLVWSNSAMDLSPWAKYSKLAFIVVFALEKNDIIIAWANGYVYYAAYVVKWRLLALRMF